MYYKLNTAWGNVVVKYIKIGTIQSLIAQADEENRPLYITAPIGWGKTAAVEYFYRRVSHITIDCASGEIEQKTAPNKIRPRVVIFDNVSYLQDEASKKYVLDMMKYSDKHIIFTSRAPRPGWLMSKTMDDNVILADHRDMRFSKEQVFKLLEEAGVHASEAEMLKVLEDSRSNPLVLWCIANYMKSTCAYTNEVNTFARITYHTYLDNELLGRLTKQEEEFLLSMCWYPSFTFDLARELNDGLDCRPVVDSIQKKNAYILTFSSVGVQLYDSFIDYLRHKRNILWSDEKHTDNLCRAAEHYRMHGNIRAALTCYQAANANDQIFALLENQAADNATIASVNELVDFYTALNPEEIKKSWPLISVMSMAESLNIKPSKSEWWFNYLKQYYENETDEDIKKQIYRRIVFLDLMLPHHGNQSIRERFYNVIDSYFPEPGIITHEYIDMMPTILHGAIDFCDASKNEDELFTMCERMVQSLKGRASIGILDILKAELAYEKDQLNDFEIHGLLDKGFVIADADGSFSGCFAAVGISVHLNLFRGNIQRSEELLDSIRTKAVDVKNDVLLNNIDALYSWVDQLHSNRESVIAWLETAPDEGVKFTFLQRSIMLCKVRAYIIIGRFDAALDLIERLLTLFEMYDRIYAYYETLIYKAIVYYRLKKPEYKSIIDRVVEKAFDLGFYHMIADHGSAVLPLLEKGKPNSVSKEYFEHLVKMVRQMAENFPNYLQTVDDLNDPLTKTERRVLHLLCEGLNAEEISEVMNITYSGIKFHNKNIYRKLGVTNRIEATRKAFMLGLNNVQ